MPVQRLKAGHSRIASIAPENITAILQPCYSPIYFTSPNIGVSQVRVLAQQCDTFTQVSWFFSVP
jgi:hypothetical protein